MVISKTIVTQMILSFKMFTSVEEIVSFIRREEFDFNHNVNLLKQNDEIVFQASFETSNSDVNSLKDSFGKLFNSNGSVKEIRASFDCQTSRSVICGVASNYQDFSHSEHSTSTSKNSSRSEAEEIFNCTHPNCGKSYHKKSHLKAHVRRHSGDKPFQCNWQDCSRKFSRSDELSRHKRSHTGTKPYPCSLCEKRFTRSDHLRKHIKVHLKMKNKLTAKMFQSR